MNTMRILVTFANQYEVQNEKTGEITAGCTVNYFFCSDDENNVLKTCSNKSGAIGYQRAKVSLDHYKRDKFVKVPAIYDATMEMAIGSDGKPVLKVVDAEYVCDVVISAVK